ncbi:MAG: twin-arginine translocase subunit TatB [Rudaea sp.]|uniref:Sec-independent protein translocase protein TatB n=1 Tax=unclassified Rudaea TaxID=2627037 RepID=UPI0010F9869E|nr:MULTISPECIES: Sec-independent protein translocase protein TatB [unclassified Rudaea]MBN8885407.1 twin-arginine translocase subunit TatB [Rudaea sp.]MBR0346779.1 twin-arginine translocase subunit TatB [Rudaea sp.]
MFDFSFGEIGLIAVVALLVLGPERLPKVARTAGALARRARNSWQSVRDEIERELQAEDLKRSIEEAKRAATDLHNDLRNTSAGIQSSVQQTAREIEATAVPPIEPPPSAPPPPPDTLRHEQH